MMILSPSGSGTIPGDPLPLHYPQFDKIRDEHFAPAFDRGMAEHLKEIDAIANVRSVATFDNTILPLEKTGQLLTRANTVFNNLSSADTNDVRDKLDADYSPKFAAHFDAIYLNSNLFNRVKAVYDTREQANLDPESKRLVEKYYTDFVRAGAQLSDTDKARLKQINGELASLGAKFSQNVLKEVNASALVVDSREELAGLSDEQIAAAAEAAKTRKLEGKYVIALLKNHEARANSDRAEVKERLDKLELELRLTHQKIVQYQLQHAEQDRREFNELRRK